MVKLQQVRLGLGGAVLAGFRPVGVVAHHHAARAGGDDLVAVEAVAADVPDGARGAARVGAGGVAGAQRLGGVLDENEVVGFGQRHQAGQVGHVAEHMHHHHGLDMGAGGVVDEFAVLQGAAAGAELLHGGGVQTQGIVTAQKHRLCAHVAGGGVDGGDEGQRRNQHLIPGAEAGGHGRQMQRTGAGVGRHRTGHAHISGKFFFKFRHLAAAGGHPAGGDRLGGVGGLFFAKVGHGKRYKC